MNILKYWLSFDKLDFKESNKDNNYGMEGVYYNYIENLKLSRFPKKTITFNSDYHITVNFEYNIISKSLYICLLTHLATQSFT